MKHTLLLGALLTLAACSTTSSGQRNDGAPQAPDGPAAAPALWSPKRPCLHAHNDYLHDRPLLDALDHRACSVEADLYLVDGALLVGHTLGATDPTRTLESLYLAPLAARIAANGGSVYGDGMQLTLLLDIKGDAEEIYAAVELALQDHAQLMTRFSAGGQQDGPLLALISGNRPLTVMAAQPQRLAAVDGRVPELDDPALVGISPWVSQNWFTSFTWNGQQGSLPTDQRTMLEGLVQRVHANGQKLRFWSTAERPAMWDALLAAGVDLIGADGLDAAQAHLEAWLASH